MPMINPDSTSSISNNINEAGDRINAGIAGMQARTQQQEAQDRVLHPATQKWLQKVISGEMSPAEAAVAAHQEHDGLGTPHYGQQAVPGGVDAQPASAGAYQMDEANGGAGGMTAAARETPFRERDMGPLKQTADMARNSSEAKTNQIFAKNAGARDVANIRGGAQTDAAIIKDRGGTERAGIRAGTADKDRSERAREADMKNKTEDSKIAAMLQRARMAVAAKQREVAAGRSDKMELELVKEKAARINTLDKEIGHLQGERLRAASLGLYDDVARKQNEQNEKEIDIKVYEMQRELDRLQGNPVRREPTERSGLSSPPIPQRPAGEMRRPNVPQGQAAPDEDSNPNDEAGEGGPAQGETPDIPQGSPAQMRQPGVQLPVQTPVRDPSALPPPRGGSVGTPQPTGKGSNDMVLVTDKRTGQKRPVPKSVVEAALREDKAGFQNGYTIAPYSAFGE